MKIPSPSDDWPASWKLSYQYDKEEVFGEVTSWPYHYSYQSRRNVTLQLLCQNLEPGSRILDVAAGQGNFSIALAERGYDVHWNDLREDLIDYVKLKQDMGKVTYHPGNVFDLRFAHTFDAILITEVIEHVAHPDQFLEKIASLVRPGGRIVMTTPNGAFIKNTLLKFSETINPSIFEESQFKPDGDGHIFLLHPDEIPLLADKSGLLIDSIQLLNAPLSAGYFECWIKLEYIPRQIVELSESIANLFPMRFQAHYCRMMAVRFIR